MYREIINTIPFSILMLVLMISFMVITYLVSQLSYYLFPDDETEKHDSLANHLMGILTGGFFVLLAFIIVNTWNHQQEAQRAVLKETNCLAMMLKDIKAFPPKPQEHIKKAIEDYVVSVRVAEWKLMRLGEANSQSFEKLDKINASIRDFSPKTNQETLYYRLVITNSNCVLEGRRNRLDKMESIIPPEMRNSIILGSIIFALVIGMIRGKDQFINLIPMLLFSALLGFNLAIALNLDYPFSGNITISNAPFYEGSLGEFSD